MNTMNYKGYTAKITFDEDDEIFVGRVENIQDMIAFHGSSVEELKTAFYELIDFYFESCTALGGEPNVPKKTRRIPRSVQQIEKSV